MITMFFLKENGKSYKFTCKQTYSNRDGHQYVDHKCNGIAVTGSYYNQALARFKQGRR